jgi:LacI family transcriptional regulator
MSATKRIAVQMELAWPVRRHYDVLAGIYEYADRKGNWIIETSRFPELRMDHGIEFDGVVGRIEPGMHAAAERAGLPLVNVWVNSPVADQIVNVHADLTAASALAAEHLVARGLRHVAHFCGEGAEYRSHSRYAEGVRRVAEAAGCSFASPRVDVEYENTPAEWRQLESSVHAFMNATALPVGIVISGDMLARTVAQIILDMGYRIPDDVSIVSLGNESVAAIDTGLTLSSVDMGFTRTGYVAAELLDRLMQGERLQPGTRNYVSPKELVVRRSSDAYAIKDEAVAAALQFMVDNVRMVIGVPDIVRAAGIGRQALERRFREEVGRTINAELVRLRVERLKRLLIDTGTPVSQLHAEAGFGTSANMFSTFKRVTGTTPKEYREDHGEVAARRLFVNVPPPEVTT